MALRINYVKNLGRDHGPKTVELDLPAIRKAYGDDFTLWVVEMAGRALNVGNPPDDKVSNWEAELFVRLLKCKEPEDGRLIVGIGINTKEVDLIPHREVAAITKTEIADDTLESASDDEFGDPQTYTSWYLSMTDDTRVLRPFVISDNPPEEPVVAAMLY